MLQVLQTAERMKSELVASAATVAFAANSPMGIVTMIRCLTCNGRKTPHTRCMKKDCTRERCLMCTKSTGLNPWYDNHESCSSDSDKAPYMYCEPSSGSAAAAAAPAATSVGIKKFCWKCQFNTLQTRCFKKGCTRERCLPCSKLSFRDPWCSECTGCVVDSNEPPYSYHEPACAHVKRSDSDSGSAAAAAVVAAPVEPEVKQASKRKADSISLSVAAASAVVTAAAAAATPNASSHAWSEIEDDWLILLVCQNRLVPTASKSVNLNWAGISSRLKSLVCTCVHNAQSCANRWTALYGRIVFEATREWTILNDHALIVTVYECAAEDITEIDWKQINPRWRPEVLEARFALLRSKYPQLTLEGDITLMYNDVMSREKATAIPENEYMLPRIGTKKIKL